MWKTWGGVAAGALLGLAVGRTLLRPRPPSPPLELALFFDNDSHTCGSREGLRCDDPDCAYHRLMRIVLAIGAAVSTLDVCQYIVSSRPLHSALAAAQKRGVRVRAILDHDMAFNSGSKAFAMLDDGIRVKTKSSLGLMHHKFCIIDGGVPGRATLVTGSMNWTNQASFSNWENVLMTRSPGLVGPFRAEFERLWASFPDLTLAGSL